MGIASAAPARRHRNARTRPSEHPTSLCTVVLSDREKVALLAAALRDLRAQLPTLPLREHVDDLLRLTDNSEYQRVLHGDR